MKQKRKEKEEKKKKKKWFFHDHQLPKNCINLYLS